MQAIVIRSHGVLSMASLKRRGLVPLPLTSQTGPDRTGPHETVDLEEEIHWKASGFRRLKILHKRL